MSTIIDLTTALRPSLLPDETLLFVQDAVGLYEGKTRIPELQNGQAYLTTHRACYIDNAEPRKKAVAVHLKDVERSDFYAGFLKSSAKVTLFAKPPKYNLLASRTPTLNRNGIEGSDSSSGAAGLSTASNATSVTNATWICPICSFSNPVPSNFDPVLANDSTILPPCLACGIKPPLAHIVKATLASISNRPVASTEQPKVLVSNLRNNHTAAVHADDTDSVTCPRCTFRNHSSLMSCEICGASLGTARSRLDPETLARSESPAYPAANSFQITKNPESIKFSFRGGGEKLFYERLKGALTQRKWLLQSAPAVPRYGTSPVNNSSGNMNSNSSGSGVVTSPKTSNIGIAGLERRGTELRKNNEVVIGNAFEDLAALMASAKEIIALAEQFSSQAKHADGSPFSGGSGTDPASLLSQLNLTTTREMLAPGGSSNANANTLYLTELSRQLAEYLTDDRTGILKSEGGIISLVDLWAVFNVARRGVELVSPTDFADAVGLFEKLQLPVRLRRFKSGLLVVQGKDRTDEKTVQAILGWLKTLRDELARAHGPTSTRSSPDISIQWGPGVTALETAEQFGWSVGVAAEELEMAEDKGALCREVGIEGVRFWENWFVAFAASAEQASASSIDLWNSH